MKITIELNSADLADDAARLVQLFGPLLVSTPRLKQPAPVSDDGLPNSSNSVDGAAVLDAVAAGDVAAATAAATQPKRGRGRPKNPQPRPEAPADMAQPLEPVQTASAPAAAVQESGEQATPSADPVTTEEQARAAVDALFKAKGLVVAQGALARVGAKRFPDVLPGSYATLVEVCNEAMGAA